MNSVFSNRICMLNDGKVIWENYNEEKDYVKNIILNNDNIFLIIDKFNKGYDISEIFSEFMSTDNNCHLIYDNDYNVKKSYNEVKTYDEIFKLISTDILNDVIDWDIINDIVKIINDINDYGKKLCNNRHFSDLLKEYCDVDDVKLNLENIDESERETNKFDKFKNQVINDIKDYCKKRKVDIDYEDDNPKIPIVPSDINKDSWDILKNFYNPADYKKCSNSYYNSPTYYEKRATMFLYNCYYYDNYISNYSNYFILFFITEQMDVKKITKENLSNTSMIINLSLLAKSLEEGNVLKMIKDFLLDVINYLDYNFDRLNDNLYNQYSCINYLMNINKTCNEMYSLFNE